MAQSEGVSLEKIAKALERIADSLEGKKKSVADWMALPPEEAGSNPCLRPYFKHDDNRQCGYHNRLGIWIFRGGYIPGYKRCMRPHETGIVRTARMDSLPLADDVNESVSQLQMSQHVFNHEDRRVCAYYKNLESWLFVSGGSYGPDGEHHYAYSTCLRDHNGVEPKE